MTLDELKRIDDAASSAKSLSEKLRNAAGLLAAIRNAEQQRSALEIVHELGRSYGYGSDDAKAALHAVLDEQIADALRIAELRLEAKARAARAKHRALTEQVRSFFDEEANP